ncbi:MAG TPA: 7TM-DISM domain-containing protein, partial [Oligoflexus sp.]|uniref:7TM-DISM domain-containing protein n=1 Tax=Oligoflexus sp. TaxID=1971216 RepID=UPI002D62D2AC
MRSLKMILAILILIWGGPQAFGENAWVTVDDKTEKLEISRNLEWQIFPAGPKPSDQEFLSRLQTGWQRGTFDGKRIDLPNLDLVKPIYRIVLKKGKNVFFGMLQHGNGRMDHPLVIYSIESYVKEHPRRSVFNGIVYGVAITMFFYNLCMYVFFRKIYFIYYCLYVGSYTFALMYGGGHLPPMGAYGGIIVPIGAALLFLYLFKSSALSLKRQTPKLYNLYTTANLANLGTFFYFTVISFSWGYAFILVLLVVALGLACTVLRAIQGYRPAYFFILGW